MIIQADRPNFSEIRKTIIENSPEVLGGIPKGILLKTLRLLDTEWEKVQCLPLSPEGVRHIRPVDLPGLPKAVEIFGKEIYMMNKGRRTRKLGFGCLKEVVRGAHLNTAKSSIHATIRYRGQLTRNEEETKALIQKEVRIQRLFQGDDAVIQLFHTCSYRSKEKSGESPVEKISLAMEDCDQGELFKTLQEGEDFCEVFHDSKEAIIGIVSDMLTSLKVLEEKQVIHRDIKQENLFLRAKNGIKLKLGDFGCSGTVDEEKQRLQKAGEDLGGSWEYVSPTVAAAYVIVQDRDEEFRSKHPQAIEEMCSLKDNVWAMGIALYDFLMGDLPPFIDMGDLPEEVPQLTQKEVDAHLEDALQPDKIIWNSLEGDKSTQDHLYDLIRGMLQVDPEKRPSGSELLKLLQQQI